MEFRRDPVLEVVERGDNLLLEQGPVFCQRAYLCAYEIEDEGYGEHEQQHRDDGGEAAGQMKLCLEDMRQRQQEHGEEHPEDKGGKDGFAKDCDIEQGNEANEDHCQLGIKGCSKLCVCHICNILQNRPLWPILL